ncbi:MAG: hypothetical protein JW888_01450, partial [Pirellulales bacterium]|nr:hypothetical protein [Pirellulales bacterium]
NTMQTITTERLADVQIDATKTQNEGDVDKFPRAQDSLGRGAYGVGPDRVAAFFRSDQRSGRSAYA